MDIDSEQCNIVIRRNDLFCMVCYSETYKRDLKVIRKKNSKSEVRKQAGDEGENDIKLVNLRNRVKRITIEKLRLRDPKRKYKMRESEDK